MLYTFISASLPGRWAVLFLFYIWGRSDRGRVTSNPPHRPRLSTSVPGSGRRGQWFNHGLGEGTHGSSLLDKRSLTDRSGHLLAWSPRRQCPGGWRTVKSKKREPRPGGRIPVSQVSGSLLLRGNAWLVCPEGLFQVRYDRKQVTGQCQVKINPVRWVTWPLCNTWNGSFLLFHKHLALSETSWYGDIQLEPLTKDTVRNVTSSLPSICPVPTPPQVNLLF
jgi:hypothetical protein